MDPQTPEPITTAPVSPVIPQPSIPAATPPAIAPTPVVSENTSGMKDKSGVPEEIKGWSWAGFLWTWIWAIGNKTWIGLLALINPISFIIAIILGVKGREWAWKNKKWESVEEFNRVQRSWVKWWLIIVLPLWLLSFLGIMAFAIISAIDPKAQIEKAGCLKSCQTSQNPYSCMTACSLSIQNPGNENDSETQDSLDYYLINPTLIPYITPVPTTNSTPAVVPTIKPTVAPVPTTSTNSKLQSLGAVMLENGITGQVTSANLSGNTFTFSITFRNTTSTVQQVRPIRVQVHDPTLGTADPRSVLSSDINPGKSQSYTFNTEKLPGTPYKIQYATDSDLITLGTYTP